MRRWVGISLCKNFFLFLVFAFGFGGSSAWAPATAAVITPETHAQFDALQSMDCHKVQGFLYSKPLPAEEFQAWISDRQ